MKIAILQCDDVVEKLQPQFGHYHDMIRHMLRTHAPAQTFEFEVFDCQQQCYPADIDDFDCYITTGSKASAYDDAPWIARLIDFVSTLDQQRKKLIGICFGHQIIALALGHEVRKSDKGWGIGIASNRVIATPDWMSTPATTINILVSHQDQVMSVPADAIVIAESDFCPYFVVQWNHHFLSIQGHPEWNNAYSAALIDARRNIIPARRVNEALRSLRQQPDNALWVSWMIDFIQA